MFEDELASEPDPHTRLAVEAAALDTLMMFPDRAAERARRLDAIEVPGDAPPVLRNAVLAHKAWLAIEVGAPSAAETTDMARQAIAGGELLEEVWKRSAYHLCARALVLTDAVDYARAAIMRMREHAIARGSLRLRAASCWYGAEHARRVGDVTVAENEARMVFDLVDEDVNMLTGGATEVLVWALAERGAFEEAHELMRERRLDAALGGMIWEIGVRHSRARLWLAEGEYDRALVDACEVGALRERQGRPNPTWTPWRSTAAVALAHMGRRAEAIEMADVELDRARRWGAPTPIMRALHAGAVAEPHHESRIELSERALAVSNGISGQIETVRIRLELGNTLAYLGRRVEARDALRPALADADELGATLLADRARRELVATGLRPRKAALEGPAALTPRQRQVCDLAAAGKVNRQIAQELFLSVKTVETHLAAGYKKLGVNTRADLARELAG
jgi:DNA-binding CsgD family transcriptional regulator